MKEEYISGKVSIAEILSILDSCEAANLKHLQRIEQLETLCRVLYRQLAKAQRTGKVEVSWSLLAGAMDELGLLDEEMSWSLSADVMEELGLLAEQNDHLMDTFFKDADGKTPVEQLEALTEACRKQVD